MPDIASLPTTVPYGADQTVYLVVDCIGAGSSRRETCVERPDFDTVIAELLAGQFNAPVRVIAFNTLEHWRRDISREVADEIQMHCDIEGVSVPEHIDDFVASYVARPQPCVAAAAARC